MSTRSFRGRSLTSFSGFRGVDFSSSPLDVDMHRASEMENFVSDFGILKKRNGWRQERELVDAEGNRLPVCGVFPYKSGDVSHVLVHAGDRFLRLTENGYERIGKELSGLVAERSEAYLRGGRLYIIGCGDYLVYGSWDGGASFELRRVYDDEDTYIPVTTVNIGSSDIDVSATLDAVNLLSPWRKNRLNGVVVTWGSYEDGSSFRYIYEFSDTYYLDAPAEMLSRVVLRVMETEEEIVFEDVQDAVFSRADGSRAGYRHIDALGNIHMIFDNEADVPTGSFEIVNGSSTYTCSGGDIRSSFKRGSYTVDGSILTLSCSDFKSGALTVGEFTLDCPIEQTRSFYTLDYLHSAIRIKGVGSGNYAAKPDLSAIEYGDGEDVFEVTFRAVAPEEEGVVPYPERIRGCRFGVLFGVDGASDRLFLSGNARLPSTEFYSEADDFTYFPDVNTVQPGSDSVPIVGYLRLSDGALAVFKQKSGVGDATIYYKTAYYKQYNATDGGLERIDAVFPTVAGNSGEAMLSRHAAVDFGGDKLFLSENGVFGVVVSQNITVNERYTRERSRVINARLTREDGLSDAVATVYKDKLWLAVNGNVYVADSRYRNTRADNMDSAWGYEWYFLSGVPASVFAEIDGVLWFGTKDGRLCRFDSKYADRTYSLYGPGEVTLHKGRSERFFEGVAVSAVHRPSFSPGDTFTTSDELFGVVMTDFSKVDGGRIYCRDTRTLAAIPEGERLFAYQTDGTALSERAVYEVRDIDLIEGCFSLYKDGKPCAPGGVTFALLKDLRGLSLDVISVEDSCAVLGLFGEAMELVGNASLTGKLWHREPVCARWVSCVTDLGVSMVGKSLHRLSITCEPTVRGRVSFGYNTRLGSGRDMAGGGDVFSFEALDFRSFSFETGFASSYSARIFERNVNYLTLAVESREPTACAFNRLELLWSLGGYLSGVR